MCRAKKTSLRFVEIPPLPPRAMGTWDGLGWDGTGTTANTTATTASGALIFVSRQLHVMRPTNAHACMPAYVRQTRVGLGGAEWFLFLQVDVKNIFVK